MIRSNLKRVIFIAALTLSLLGFSERNPLLAEDSISDRNALLARVKTLKKNFEATSGKFRALKKKYEQLFEQARQIEKRIDLEKQKIRELKTRREKAAREKAAAQAIAQTQGLENLTKQPQPKKDKKETALERALRAKRQKVINQLLRQLESQKQQPR